MYSLNNYITTYKIKIKRVKSDAHKYNLIDTNKTCQK